MVDGEVLRIIKLWLKTPIEERDADSAVARRFFFVRTRRASAGRSRLTPRSRF